MTNVIFIITSSFFLGLNLARGAHWWWIASDVFFLGWFVYWLWRDELQYDWVEETDEEPAK